MQTGEVIADRFEIERRVASGGMGHIYRARDRASGEIVAFKLLHGHASERPVRFQREVDALLQLRHPTIVRYVANGTTDKGVPWLAMEWLEGVTLGERLVKGPLGIDESIEVAAGIAESQALAAVHRGGVHPPRSQAEQHLPRGRRGLQGGAHRLRAGAALAGAHRADRARHGAGHHRVPGSGAGAGRAQHRRPRRRVRAGVRDLPLRDRQAALRGRGRPLGAAQDHRRAAAAPARGAGGGARRARRSGDADAVQGPGLEAPRRTARRSRRRPPRWARAGRARCARAQPEIDAESSAGSWVWCSPASRPMPSRSAGGASCRPPAGEPRPDAATGPSSGTAASWSCSPTGRRWRSSPATATATDLAVRGRPAARFLGRAALCPGAPVVVVSGRGRAVGASMPSSASFIRSRGRRCSLARGAAGAADLSGRGLPLPLSVRIDDGDRGAPRAGLRRGARRALAPPGSASRSKRPPRTLLGKPTPCVGRDRELAVARGGLRAQRRGARGQRGAGDRAGRGWASQAAGRRAPPSACAGARFAAGDLDRRAAIP